MLNVRDIMMSRIYQTAKGAITFVPLIYKRLSRSQGGHTSDFNYCYTQWLKHIKLLEQAGMDKIPESFVELGPGDTPGVGIAALASGVNRYYGVDVDIKIDPSLNLQFFERIIPFLSTNNNAKAATWAAWPACDDIDGEIIFPRNLLNQEMLAKNTGRERVEIIRRVLSNKKKPGDSIEFSCVSNDDAVDRIESGSVDLVSSTFVLQHVVDLEEIYSSMGRWVRPGGWMSHQIDFSALGFASKWNGHWSYEDWMWKIASGNRPFAINRAPYSRHVELINNQGFDIIYERKMTRLDGLSRCELATPFRLLSEDDLNCAGVFIVAKKRADDVL